MRASLPNALKTLLGVLGPSETFLTDLHFFVSRVRIDSKNKKVTECPQCCVFAIEISRLMT